MSYSKNLLLGALTVLIGWGCVPAGPAGTPTPTDRAGGQAEARAERESGRERPEEVVRGEEAVPTPKVRIGVIISQSGDPFLEQFAAQVLEGVELAITSYNESTVAPAELLILDDQGDPGRAAALVRELEERGAVAIIGPLRREGIESAARARRDSSLILLSPTAPDLPLQPNTFTLNTVDTRGAELIAKHALSAGYRRIGMIYPESPEYRRQAEAFRRTIEDDGGQIIAAAPYPRGTSTFSEQIRTIAAAEPDAVFIPVSERDARQIAPQLIYYGLAETGAQILGTEGWSGDEVLHGVPARYLEGIRATTTLYRPSPEFGWNDFVDLYENTYRQSLDNALPALGFDAANFVLRALGEGRTTPIEITERFKGPDEMRGATGWISIKDGVIGRRPIIVEIIDGELVPVAGGPEAQ